MITVFGGWPSRSQRVLWLLEELGIPYVFHPVDLRDRRSDPEFMAANAAGFLPAIADGEVRLCESVAIMEYLLARHGPTPLAPRPFDPAFPSYQQFLHLGEAGLAAYRTSWWRAGSSRPRRSGATGGRKPRLECSSTVFRWLSRAWKPAPIWRAKRSRRPTFPSATRWNSGSAWVWRIAMIGEYRPIGIASSSERLTSGRWPCRRPGR